MAAAGGVQRGCAASWQELERHSCACASGQNYPSPAGGRGRHRQSNCRWRAARTTTLERKLTRLHSLIREERFPCLWNRTQSHSKLARAGIPQEAPGFDTAPEGWWQKLRICCLGKSLWRGPGAVIRKGSWLGRVSGQRATLSFSRRCHVLSPSSRCSPRREAGKDTPRS